MAESASDLDIKKSYRKLAIKLHPDKNKHPQSSEAFKKLAKAFEVLSDTGKRKIFDQTGSDPDSRGAPSMSSSGAGFGGANPRMNPFMNMNGGMPQGFMFDDDILNMFFGGPTAGFGGNTFTFHFGGPGGGAGFQGPRGFGPRPTRQRANAHARDNQTEHGKLWDLITQLGPLLIVFVPILLGTLFGESNSNYNKLPKFSFETSPMFSQERFTPTYRVPYYVNPNSLESYSGGSDRLLRNLDKSVEQYYVTDLRNKCHREETLKDRMIEDSYGWFFVDNEKLERAQQLELKSCDRQHTPQYIQQQQHTQPPAHIKNLTPDQLQNIYKRLQLLRSQHGENAKQLPEFAELASVLTQFSQYQRQLKARGQMPQFQDKQSFTPMQQQPQPQQQQQQQQQQQPPQPNKPGSFGPSQIFSPPHSQLLKYQIAAFKKFIQNQPIEPELANVINISFQQYNRQVGEPNASLDHQNGAFFKQQQQQQPQQKQHLKKDPFVPVQKPQIPQMQSAKASPMQPNQQLMAGQPVMMNQQPQARTPSAQPQQFHMPPQPPVIKQEPPKQPPAKGLPPHAPAPLEEMTKKYPDVSNIITTVDPQVMVDSFSLPRELPPVPFEFLDNPKSKIITPSLYPKPLDIVQAAETEKLVNQLHFQQELDELEKLKDEDEDYILEYTLMTLLPYQKAVRGHVVSTVFHQNSLLTNHLPNFSARVRGVNTHDASITHALYNQQKTMTALSKRNMLEERQANILSVSDDYKKYLSSRKDKLSRIARGVHNFHAQTEKEEQRRVERNAKQRLQALKANDEEAYIKLLDQTKDTRITHILRQTTGFLRTLIESVKVQQRDTQEHMVHYRRAESEEAPVDEQDEEERENADYYSVAHRVQEKIEKQPSILVGGTLKEYQIRGLEWMVSLFNNHLNGILADEMGLGKTIQTISLLTYITEVKKIPGPFLVIVPLSTLPNWNLEFDKWAPSLKKISYKGSPQVRKELAFDVRAGNFNVLLTTYEYVIKDKYLLSKVKWVHMIIDEGHRMKNTKSKLSSTLTEYYHSDYRLILTGTPLQNNLPELWALLNFVLPKIFNSDKSFDDWFNTPFANTGTQDKLELSEEETLLVIRRLHKVLRPFLLRRLKKDVEKSLPNKVEKVIKCRKSGLQVKLYHQMLKYNQLFVGDSDSKAPVGIKGMNNKLMQLRKICNHPFVFPAIEDMINPSHENNDTIWRTSGKFELLDRILPKFRASGHRVLMFFQMTQIMDIMEDFLRFRGMHYMRLDGDTKADDRTALLKDFNADDSPYFVFLLSTRAGGLGLNLQTADTVIIFDTDWNPHQDLQAQDRAHRIGQKNEVRILRLITSDSIEEYILERAHQKLDIDGKVIQAGKFDQKSTSEEQEALLRQLLEAEENEKDEDEVLDDNDLNEILARNEDELKTFQKLDEERIEEAHGQPRLIAESELPEIYNQEPEITDEAEEMLQYGRGTRERKVQHYDENITEEQWLREINGYASDDDGARPKKSRKRRKKNDVVAEELDGLVDENGDLADFIDDDDEEVAHKKPKTAKRKLKVGSERSTRSPSELGDSAPQTPAGGFIAKKRKGRGQAASAPICRKENFVPQELTMEERHSLQLQLNDILDQLLNMNSEDGRKLSAIFLTKPVKRIYPDYYVIIKNPIAFDGIKRRVQGEIYYNLEEFMYDLHLMFANARIYNQEGSVVYNDANDMEQEALRLYANIRDGATMDFTEFDERFGLKRNPPAAVAGQPVNGSFVPEVAP
ncbi:hypothetical protein OGAPHI_003859 [Ogataea philodendri]|uniref:Uncharacterized protein n=1 Tax=Ogataea philodendri TaxID=1378263 RepID=A0A9P8T4F4_9ASCO|nr:uncharacterized protein OGAPHI_003859 [Ogataea philodendri]KAH3665671.1 hypothetical protein OGAPHI_003859 [Ogataea philodendri]